jgi:hypothetical protein
VKTETGYRHTQKGTIHWLLLSFALLAAFGAWQGSDESPLAVTLAVVALLFALLGLSFRQLTTEDRGERLAVRFGPLPLFQKQIPYAAMTSVAPGQSSLIDGLGIHWVPGRGWIYNLSGFDCVVVHAGDQVIRIGTDDPDGLLRFLKQRTQGQQRTQRQQRTLSSA